MKRALLAIFGLVCVLHASPVVAKPFDETAATAVSRTDSTKAGATITPPIPVRSGFHLRVAGYNIAHARGGTLGKRNLIEELAKRKNLEGIAKLLRDNKVDVVGLTEISHGDLRAALQKQPERLAKLLGGFHQVYGENVKHGWGGLLATQGNAIVSRYPILSFTNHKLYKSDEKHEQRGCLEALLDLGKGGKLRVFVAHLSLVAEESTKQIEEIWGFVAKSTEPVLLLGDFNSRPASARVKWLSERMTDTSANINTTFGNKPDVKIDYQFSRGPMTSGTAWVTGFKEGYSDHGCLINDYWIAPQK